MKPRISFITIGVDDLERSLRFYQGGLGLPTKGIVGQEYEHGAVVFLNMQAGVTLALWPRASIAHDTGLPAGARSSTEFTLAHNVWSKHDVDKVMTQAEAAGAEILKAPHDTFWGGYTGYFRDPDGHVWEVAWNPAVPPPADESTERVTALIRDLALKPHPEGGHFVEVFRSESRVKPSDQRAERRALTTIYYLLAEGEVSRWHQVRSDEVWHFCEGAPLDLLVLSDDVGDRRTHAIGSLAEAREPMVTVRAGEWQAARSTGAYSLVACVVAPGFDFDDFRLARDVPAVEAEIRRRHDALAALL